MLRWIAASLCAFMWAGTASAAPADRPWQVAGGAGADFGVAPAFGGHGWVVLDATRRDVAGGRLRLYYNTETLQVGLEGVPVLGGKLELGVAARGELLLAGVMVDYYEDGARLAERGFLASYALLLPSLKWHAAPGHSFELVPAVRQWFFGKRDSTANDLVLPPDTFVFEPRLFYTFWKIAAGEREWQAHTFFPRVQGIAISVQLGLDLRTDRRAWGASIGGTLDPRNAPGEVILSARQRLLAGIPLGGALRLQIEEYASWGAGEDDLTRNRVGGMNPYVVPLHGLPWAVLLSERLVSGQLALHVPFARGSHELGVAVSGGAFNDVRRSGALDSFGGGGGAGVFGDLRFGELQVHARFGCAFPAEWLPEPPYLSALLTAGARFW